MAANFLLILSSHSNVLRKLQPKLCRKFSTLALSTVASAYSMEDHGFAKQGEILEHKDDNYEGVIVEPSSLPTDGTVFQAGLTASVQAWKAQGKGGVWLKLPIAMSGHVPIATSLGFIFHHAEPEYVMLTKWLQDRPSPLPASASHQVGVGVLVLNDRDEMLVVKEKKGPAAKLDIWKVPTGLLDRAEDFSAAAVREVKEEAGIDVVFKSLLCMRQAHGFAFGKSDLFMLCAAELDKSKPWEADETGMPRIKPCDKEIQAAKWMPVEEYATSDFAQSHATVQEFAKCMLAYKNGTYAGFDAKDVLGIRGGPQLIIHGVMHPPDTL